MRNYIHRSFTRAILPGLAIVLALPPSLPAADQGEEIKLLREQLRALEQKLLVLERKQEIKEEAAAAAAPTTAKVAATDKGFALASADGANSIRFRGLVQLDHRLFFNDGGIVNNGFLLRRARLITEGVLAKNYSFQFVTEFGGSAVSIQDANLGLAVSPALQLKLGKFKSPVGLELLQSDAWTFFNERSLVTNLVPNRDLGIQASGEIGGGRLSYAVGIFGGVPDAGSTGNTDFDNEKDLAGRVIVAPFKNNAGSAGQGFSLGIAGSFGREKTAAGRTSGYRTDGQQTFFAYNAATIADGRTWRVSPQVDYRNGSLGLIGEYVFSTVNLRPGPAGPKSAMKNKGWQLAAGYVLTGEDSSYTGVAPKNNFDFAAGTWGAFELAARYADLRIDDAAFPLYASPASNASHVSSFGAGLNWYLSKAVALKLDYYRTHFGFYAAAPAVSTTPALRQDEKSFITRFQVAL